MSGDVIIIPNGPLTLSRNGCIYQTCRSAVDHNCTYNYAYGTLMLIYCIEYLLSIDRTQPAALTNQQLILPKYSQ